MTSNSESFAIELANRLQTLSEVSSEDENELNEEVKKVLKLERISWYIKHIFIKIDWKQLTNLIEKRQYHLQHLNSKKEEKQLQKLFQEVIKTISNL